MKRILAITGCLLLSACLVGPNFKEPPKKFSSQWLKNDAQVKQSPVKNANWWKAFNDPILTQLIQQGYRNNISLQSAGVRVLQMRAQLAQSVGELYPQQQALIGNLTYNRIGGGSLQDILPPTFETALLGFTASWELDFWGKYRRAILSNDAAFLASFAAYDNALVTLTADIASTYVDIRTTETLIRITQQNIQLQTYGVDISGSRYHAGQTSLIDLEQASTELAQTQASLPGLVTKLQQQKDRLAFLLGEPPDRIDAFLGKHTRIPETPVTIAVGIPKEALAQRPDIYQARMEAIAQSEMIGAIKAQLYPSFSLTGTFAFAANTINGNSLGNIFNWSNRTITAGPAFNWPILNYGQITNAVRQQDAVFQQALLSYVNLVLKAQQEVQDHITQFIQSKKAERYLATANRSATKSTKLALIRYKEGETDFTPVLNAERQQLQVQTQYVNAQGEIPKAMIALYRSLGGGWQIRGCNDVVPPEIKIEMAERTNWGCLLCPDHHMPPVVPGSKLEQLYLPSW